MVYDYGSIRKLIFGLRATPTIDGLFEMQRQPESQDRILPIAGLPRFFRITGFELDMAFLLPRLFVLQDLSLT